MTNPTYTEILTDPQRLLSRITQMNYPAASCEVSKSKSKHLNSLLQKNKVEAELRGIRPSEIKART